MSRFLEKLSNKGRQATLLYFDNPNYCFQVVHSTGKAPDLGKAGTKGRRDRQATDFYKPNDYYWEECKPTSTFKRAISASSTVKEEETSGKAKQKKFKKETPKKRKKVQLLLLL